LTTLLAGNWFEVGATFPGSLAKGTTYTLTSLADLTLADLLSEFSVDVEDGLQLAGNRGWVSAVTTWAC
jgi:hypothetical protein